MTPLRCVIACIIVIVLAVLFLHLIPLGAEGVNENPNNHSMTLEEKVHNINAHMSSDERAFRNYYGLGNETIGENYNSMGSSSPHI